MHNAYHESILISCINHITSVQMGVKCGKKIKMSDMFRVKISMILSTMLKPNTSACGSMNKYISIWKKYSEIPRLHLSTCSPALLLFFRAIPFAIQVGRGIKFRQPPLPCFISSSTCLERYELIFKHTCAYARWAFIPRFLSVCLSACLSVSP